MAGVLGFGRPPWVLGNACMGMIGQQTNKQMMVVLSSEEIDGIPIFENIQFCPFASCFEPFFLFRVQKLPMRTCTRSILNIVPHEIYIGIHGIDSGLKFVGGFLCMMPPLHPLVKGRFEMNYLPCFSMHLD